MPAYEKDELKKKEFVKNKKLLESLPNKKLLDKLQWPLPKPPLQKLPLMEMDLML